MSIIRREVISLTPNENLFRARFLYEFSDGRLVERGPILVIDLADSESVLANLEVSVLKNIQEQDANSAVLQNIKTAYKEASVEQVLYAWLKVGFDESEHYNAYLKIKDIGQQLLSLGLTDEQYAIMLNTTIADATATRLYWEFLEVNKLAIESYILVMEGYL